MKQEIIPLLDVVVSVGVRYPEKVPIPYEPPQGPPSSQQNIPAKPKTKNPPRTVTPPTAKVPAPYPEDGERLIRPFAECDGCLDAIQGCGSCGTCEACETCTTGCQIGCQLNCQLWCQSSCQLSCQTTCQLNCQAGCEVSCQSCDTCTNCQYPCQLACQECTGCTAPCTETCTGPCTTCQGDCQLACQSACQTGGCEDYCESYCQNPSLPEIGESMYIWLVNVNSGKYLNVHYGLDAVGTNVYQYTDDGSIDQIFKAVWNSAECAYTIRAMCSSSDNNRVLHIAGASVTEGANVEISLPGSSSRQLWQITSVGAGAYKVIAKNTDLALTSFGTSNNTTNGTTPTTPGNVFISAYTGAPSQHWQLRLNPYGNLNWGYMYAEHDVYSKISSGYKLPDRLDHYAIDVIAKTGSIDGIEVLSVCSGTVIRGKDSPSDTRGYHVVIRSDAYDPLQPTRQLTIRYLHLKYNPLVTVGTRVYAGQPVGYTNNTGSSDGTHLHFDVNNLNKEAGPWLATDCINPQKFFPQIRFSYKTSSRD